MKDIRTNPTTIVRQAPRASESARPPGARPDDQVDSGFLEKLTALQGASTANVRANGLERPSTLKFSNHAIDRMQSRGIRYSPEEMAKIENAVSKAQSKGAKETLLLTDNSALIVSVKDGTVVTVMDKAALKDNVFTKIDSTIVI